jgi:hypothetical protein
MGVEKMKQLMKLAEEEAMKVYRVSRWDLDNRTHPETTPIPKDFWTYRQGVMDGLVMLERGHEQN